MTQRQKDKSFTRRITFRLTEKEWTALAGLLEKSTAGNLSSLIRQVLFKGAVTINTRDRSLDIVMEELSRIRKELQAIGINVNQITRRFHVETLSEERLARAQEVISVYHHTGEKVTRLFTIIAKFSEKWLPES